MVSRRSFLYLGAAAGAYGLVSKVSLPLALAAEQRPHFLLSIHIQPGVDWTYLFDARIPKLTQKNLQQNYLFQNDTTPATTQPSEFTEDKIRERTVVCEKTGSTALRSPLTDELWSAHKDRLSVVNGIYMLRNNAGHSENSAYLMGNTDRGGAPIYPPIVGKHLGGAPLESVHLREFSQIFPAPTNLSGSAELASNEIAALAQTLQTGPQIDEGGRTWKHILARSDANALHDGQFAAGSQNLSNGLRRARATGVAFAGAGGSGGPPEQPSIALATRRALAFFNGGVTRVAAISHFDVLDTHDVQSAQQQVGTYTRVIADIKAAIDLLKTTMFVDAKGNGVPFIDVTTFIISSEFGRTTRSLAFGPTATVGATGTDHNNFVNSALVGGKGIVGGLIVGESDLRDCSDDGVYSNVSEAHKEKNRALDMVMGKPFDFKTQRARHDLPATWKESDYLIMPSVTNTIMDTFDLPEAQRFKLGSSAAPILHVLREGAR